MRLSRTGPQTEMRIGLVIDTPERPIEKYMISVDQFQLEWNVQVNKFEVRNMAGEVLTLGGPDPRRYENRITTAFSGLLLPYPPLPGVESKD